MYNNLNLLLSNIFFHKMKKKKYTKNENITKNGNSIDRQRNKFAS